MKKRLVILLILFFALMVNFIDRYNQSEKVLLVGEIMGFEIENIEEKNEDIKQGVVETSFQSLGTITFINEETNQFVALGHSLDIKSETPEINGSCYKATIEGFNKGRKDTIGYVIAEVDQATPIGSLLNNSENGIYGKLENEETGEYQEIETASRYKIEKGEASILLNLDGTGLKKYAVEIVDISYLSKSKNIKIKVKDEELIELTGGIIRGMSGTPVVQNGKLIGAMNYVELSNPEEAYAIFIDKLI